MYCKHCNEDLTVHADNTVTCSCNLWRTGDPIPDGWSICASDSATLEDLEAIQELGNPIDA
jgi:hypothetical protein